jgi:hypothetical protein
VLGVSGVCNVLASIKTARALQLGAGDVILSVATDGFDRYPSVLARLDGAPTSPLLFHRQRTDWVLEGTRAVRQRWHNQKYFTWVEQQGKSVEALNAQADPGFWAAEAARVTELDAALAAARGSLG